MKNDMMYFGLALVTGALIPIQAAANAAFSKSVGNPLVTGLMAFIVGLAVMILFMLISGTALPGRQQLASAPAFSYLGGLIVATYVVMITILTPRIGVGTAISFVVTGQIICAVIIDHFGLFSMAQRSVSPTRLAGMLLMAGGVYLVMKK